MKLRHLALVFIFLVVHRFTFAQKENKSSKQITIDSLIQLVKSAKEDTNKVNLYYELGQQFDYFVSKERIDNFINAFQLAEKLNYDIGIRKNAPNLITNLFHRNMYDVALSYCLKYIDYLEKRNDKTELLKVYNLFGNLLGKQSKYDEALPYYYKALAYYQSVNDLDQYATTLSNIGLLFLNKNNADSAFIYWTKAMEIFKRNNNQSRLANSVLGLAEIDLSNNNLNAARTKANESLHIYTAIKIDLGIANAKIVLGQINYRENKIDSAITDFNQALTISKQFKNYNTIKDCYLNISKCYQAQKQFEKAFESHSLFTQYDDTVASASLNNKMLEMEVKYDITKKESKLREKDMELLAKSKQRNYLLAIVAAVLILFVISYRAYVQKRKANSLISEQKKIVEEKAAEVAAKQKEILDSINYAKRIQTALVTNEKYIEKSLNRLNKS